MARSNLKIACIVGCLSVLGCGDSISEPAIDGATAGDAAIPSAGFQARGSVEQVHVWKSESSADLELVDADGKIVGQGTSDAQGALVFRNVKPGKGYEVRVAKSDPLEAVTDLTVLSVEDSLPADDFYAKQKLEPGFGYITTRDGTKLSVFVSLPGPVEDGPYPTVVNYSGYDPSRPGEPIEAGKPFCGTFPVLCDAPHDQSALIANLMGYASVGVNMRGTGCSGGAFDYWETLQVLDGYDAVEVVAAQDWVQDGEVGMTGLSYPGISQLFVAQANPPHLVAISPMSVIADTTTSTLAPGGIFNEGFAFAWAERVLEGARPYGKGWEQEVVDIEKMGGGASTCEENQLLHGQAIDAIEKAKANAYYSDEVAGPLDPTTFVDKIDVPVFLSGQWQDEQTGPHFAALLNLFDNAPVTRFTVTNGAHPDGFAPQVLTEWKTFLDLYVGKTIPTVPETLQRLAPLLFASVFEEALALNASRFESYTSYEKARADYEAEPALRVIFESGADPALDKPGAPKGTFDAFFDAWPVPGTKATRWYFQPDGSLAATQPSADGGASSFAHEAAAGQRTTLASDVTSSDEVWKPAPRYDYRPLVPGKAAAFISAPLDEELVMIGHGSIDLWLQSTAEDADLEVNLTEVRADGSESYVQSGWLRASQRALRSDATELRPTHTHREEDAAPLPKESWEPVRVELMPFAHIFRAGSRIRISVDTPGDSRAAWKFILLDYADNPTHSIAHDAEHPSSLVLPVVPGVEVPTEQPACSALRAQPCRDFEPYSNTPR